MADTPPKTNEKPPLIKYGAIAIIALMLLSGAAVYLASSSQDSTTPDPSTAPDTTPTRSLVSNEVEATVKELFPAAVIISQSRETDKTKLDEAIGKLSGVRGVQSQFTNLDFNSGSVSYLAQISLVNDANKILFIDQLFETGLLSSPEIYFQALIETPIEVQAASEDGKSEKVRLPSNQILGYVSAYTQTNDIVSGALQIVMQGTQVRNAFLFESQNITQSPRPLTLSVTAPILELQPKLIVTGSMEYVPNFSELDIETALSALPLISGVENVLIPRKDNTLMLSFSQASAITGDINAFVQSHATQFTSFSLDGNNFFIGLGNVTPTQAKAQLQQAIEQTLNTNVEIQFIVPQFQVLVDVNTSSNSTLLAAQSILSYFASLDANATIQSYQPASLSLSALQDGNSSYAIPTGKLNAYLLPGHAIGNNATVQVSATIVRNDLIEASALEAVTQ